MIRMLECCLGEGVDIRFEAGKEALFVQGDHGMLEQVLLNLAINSRDAMNGRGSLTIGLQLAGTEEREKAPESAAGAEQYVRLSVADTGCGMDKALQSRIWEPFFSTKTATRGSGLGLAVVRTIIERHAGWISVESERGKGAVFRVFLPLSTPPESPNRTRPDSLSFAAYRGSELVFLAEGDVRVRTNVALLLRHYGYRIHEYPKDAGLVAEAPALLILEAPDPGAAVMPELLVRIRCEHKDLSVILLASGECAGELRAAWAKGLPVLYKPFDAISLLRLVRAVLDCHARQADLFACHGPRSS
jgi:hypothetical protein